MALKQDRRRLETSWGRRIVIIILFILVVMLGHSVWLIYGKFIESQTARNEATAAALGLEERKIELEDKAQGLDTQRGQEEEIRQKLPVVKEGEKMIVIIDETAKDDTEASEVGYWWQNFWPF